MEKKELNAIFKSVNKSKEKYVNALCNYNNACLAYIRAFLDGCENKHFTLPTPLWVYMDEDADTQVKITEIFISPTNEIELKCKNPFGTTFEYLINYFFDSLWEIVDELNKIDIE